ncbi:hypothetical protein ABVK25_000131 [Lepraria finkii]|uniref:Uncharacterized protein n=1 Tax=Lepraria finkii TaxID=1340010 RepID=A0ABR4BM14_9LECA
MSSSGESSIPSKTVLERYTSYGIGGRGNLRRPSENKVVEITDDENGRKRRRSSVFGSMAEMFRKKTTIEEAVDDSK